MIEGIIKGLAKFISRKMGKKINTSINEKVSQKKANFNEKFEYVLKHDKMYLVSGFIIDLIGLGFIVPSLVIYFQDKQLTNNLLTCFIIGGIVFVLGIMVIINYYKYKITYNNYIITKQILFNTKQIRWDDISSITVNKTNQIVLSTNQNKITCKPILIGAVDFIYLIYTKFGKEAIYSLCESELVYKTVKLMISQYEIDLDQE